jgi:hypothetical protein
MAPYVASIYGAHQFNRIQFGMEGDATPGTAVPATHIHRGPFIDIEDTSVFQFVDEQTGLLADTGERYKSQAAATLTLPSHPFTFEHGPIHFNAGITEGVTTDTAAPYTRTYPFVVTAALVATKDINTYTWETHNVLSGDSREMAYSHVQEFSLTGEIGQPWMVEGTWQGRQVVVAAFTDALTLTDLEQSMFQNSVLYLDNVGDSVGTTSISGVMSACTINVQTGVQRVFTPNGTLSFTSVKFVKPVITGSFTFELEGTVAVPGKVIAERAAFTAGTPRLVRVKTTGTASQYWQFDAAIVYTSFGTYENADGDTTVTAEWEARYEPTTALFAKFDVANTVAAYT